jgi:hypothetical protein
MGNPNSPPICDPGLLLSLFCAETQIRKRNDKKIFIFRKISSYG